MVGFRFRVRMRSDDDGHGSAPDSSGRLMKLARTERTLAGAAAKAGMDEKTARKYRLVGRFHDFTAARRIGRRFTRMTTDQKRVRGYPLLQLQKIRQQFLCSRRHN